MTDQPYAYIPGDVLHARDVHRVQRPRSSPRLGVPPLPAHHFPAIERFQGYDSSKHDSQRQASPLPTTLAIVKHYPAAWSAAACVSSIQACLFGYKTRVANTGSCEEQSPSSPVSADIYVATPSQHRVSAFQQKIILPRRVSTHISKWRNFFSSSSLTLVRCVSPTPPRECPSRPSCPAPPILVEIGRLSA